MRIKITDTFLNNAAKRITSGQTLTDISREFGVNPDLLSRKLRAFGIDTSRNRGIGLIPAKKHELPIDKIISMYKEGISVNQISKNFSVSRKVIDARLREYGISMRTQSEAEKLKWDQMSLDNRKKKMESAHNAVRGTRKTLSDLTQRAITKSKIKNQCFIGLGESELCQLLTSNNIPFIDQAVVGKYNIDILIGTVAVELTANTARQFKNGIHIQRVKELLKRNIKTLYVSIRSGVDILCAYNDLITDIKTIDSLEPIHSQYWVIRCRTKTATILETEGNDVTLKVSPIDRVYERSTIDLT